MKVIFMGTPEFAVPSLKKLIDSANHKLVAVFSQKPKAQGRGLKITKSPVDGLASAYGIPVYTPSTLRSDEADKLINSIEADIIVVVAYGFIIPKNILEAKKHGCLNVHPSKLPKYRGAAPLQRTIINGEKETAVCIMQMGEGLDTGDILLQRDFPISNRVTFLELQEKCANLGAEMLIEVLDNIGELKAQKQPDEKVVYAHKLSKDESKIDWQDTAFAIDCKIRGMNPWPGVYFEYQGKKIKIIEAECRQTQLVGEVGALLDDKNFFEVICGQGVLRILKLQPEGKKMMNAKDYQRGLQSKSGSVKFS